MANDSPFEAIRQVGDDGIEYWSARDLAKALGYDRWENFPGVVRRAITACEGSGYPVSDHFRSLNKMVTLGSGAKRNIADVHLSRYACYLIARTPVIGHR